MTQWVKDLTTLAPSHCGGAGSIPGLGNFHMPGCSHKIKKKKIVHGWSSLVAHRVKDLVLSLL